MSAESTETKTTTSSGFPFPMMFGAEAWTKSMHDAMERSRALWDEYARLETQGLGHARTLVGEGAKMAVESMSYAAQLGAEWRKLSFEATRRVVDTVNPSR